jgi:hypothetical protein
MLVLGARYYAQVLLGNRSVTSQGLCATLYQMGKVSVPAAS